jgi:hypothetical protein
MNSASLRVALLLTLGLIIGQAATGLAQLRFDTLRAYPTSPYWVCDHLAVADFDKDGNYDVVTDNIGLWGVTPTYDYFSLLRGLPNGGGNNPFFQTYEDIRGSRGAHLFLAVDLNNDTWLDILGASLKANQFVTVLNDGSGAFMAPTSVPLGNYHPVDIATTDFNHDGVLDVVLSLNDGDLGRVALYEGSLASGHPTYSLKQVIDGLDFTAKLLVYDMDEDGWDDIVTIWWDIYGHVYLLKFFRGQDSGDTPFQLAATMPLDGEFRHLLHQDIEGDGDQDLIVASWLFPANVCVYLAEAGSGPGGIPYTTPVRFEDRYSLESLAVDDINDDGLQDLMLFGYKMRLYLARENGATGTYAWDFVERYPMGTNVSTPQVVDMNGDGIDDVVTAAYYPNHIKVHRGTGTGFEKNREQEMGFYVYDHWPCDYNGDGRMDLLVYVKDYTPSGDDISVDGVSLLRAAQEWGNSDTFVEEFRLPEITLRCVGDINKDGLLDFVDKDFTVYFAQSSMWGFLPAAYNTPSLDRYNLIGDYNEDGILDIASYVVENNHRWLALYIGLGEGAVGNGAFVRQGLFPIDLYGKIAACDIDMDGHLDIVAWEYDDSYDETDISFYLNDPLSPGDLSRHESIILPGEIWNLSFCDVDENGAVDVAVCGPSVIHGNIDLLRDLTFPGAGMVEYAYEDLADIGTHASGVYFVDVDHDLHEDLLVTGDYSLFVLRNDGSGSFSAPELFFAPDIQGQTPMLLDYDRDGMVDIAYNERNFRRFVFIQNLADPVVAALGIRDFRMRALGEGVELSWLLEGRCAGVELQRHQHGVAWSVIYAGPVAEESGRWSVVDEGPLPPGQVEYRLEVVLADGSRIEHGPVVYEAGGESPPPAALSLRCAPNPSNPQAILHYELPQAGRVSLRIYDVRGRRVRLLLDGYRQAGAGTATWDGRDDGGQLAASGTYLAVIETAYGAAHEKLVLAR